MFIKVKVKTNAKKEIIEQKNKDTYNVSVKEPAERNLANKRVCIIVASFLDVSLKNVRIVSGHQSPSKILSINLPVKVI